MASFATAVRENGPPSQHWLVGLRREPTVQGTGVDDEAAGDEDDDQHQQGARANGDEQGAEVGPEA